MSTAAVSIKLPPFWPADPEVWFAQVEAQFTTKNITTQKTKFDYVVASLSPEYATEVRDIILSPPADNPYEDLKNKLIQRTVVSERRRLQQLFTTEQLGDRKPSQLLHHMQQLLGDKAATLDNSVMKELFLQRIPAQVRMVLASTPDTTTLEELAQLADKVLEVAVPPPAVAAINNHDSDMASELQRLRTDVTNLMCAVRALPTGNRPRRRGNSTPPRTREPSPQRQLCWYHNRFGEEARKCQPPCSWDLNSRAGR